MSGGERDPSELERRLEEERRVFLNGPVVVFQWSAAPGWPVEYVSPNVEQVFGYTAEEFQSGAVAYPDVVDPQDLDRLGREVREANERCLDRCVHEPYRIRRRSGELAWLDDYTTIVRNERGEPERYLGYVIDVTERKLYERESAKLRAQLLHAQKMESMGLLAGGVAHDFNNLLIGVLGFADLAAEAPSQTSARDYLQKLKLSAERATDLCRQMLAYSGRGKFLVEVKDLNALVEGMADLLSVSVSKRVELQLDLTPEALHVEVDTTQIDQLLMNLISNAAEATSERGGRVVVQTGREAGEAYLRVVDDGIGMDEETRQRIFEPFYTTKQKGRGLGLAAVLGILRSHGGTVDVRSAEGGGATFEVRLPLSTLPLSGCPSKRGAVDPAWRARGTALIIDDEEVVRAVAGHVLRRVGFEVLVAADGDEGLDLYRTHAQDIAVVLLDLTMPGRSGVEVHRELLAQRGDLPVVLSSGFAREEVTSKFDRESLPSFLMKPFQPRELLASVREAMQSRAPNKSPRSGPRRSARPR